ncbi:MAG: bacteriorhodopsin [Candidatus Obscuribacterales bacterium]|nr:bacteriorhodopsin [Candidatus Obscuribacterales bacterium]
MDHQPNVVQLLTQLTFVTTCMAMGAGAFFFYNEREKVHPRYRLALLLESMVCGVACVMYFYMKDKYVAGEVFPTQLRYFDWLVTTPMILLEFTALLNFKDKMGALVRLVLWDMIMIVTGYMGETLGFLVGGFQFRWVMFVVSCGGWLGVLLYIYTGIRQQANLADTETRRCIMILTKFVTLGWAIYPIGYVVRAVAPELGDVCQLIYNISDAINKVGFGIVVWAAGTAAMQRLQAAEGTSTAGDTAAPSPLDGTAPEAAPTVN